MTHFQSITGNKAVKQQLAHLIEKDALPHLLLFYGAEGIGKCLFAKELARIHLKCEAASVVPDLHLFSPEGKTGMHSIASVRRLIDEVNLAPFGSRGKVLIIDDAERMLPVSANALLKTLEEPPKGTLIILVTSNPDMLLATIVSRAMRVRFLPLASHEIAEVLQHSFKKTQDEAESIAKRANGSIVRALAIMNGEGLEQETLLFSFLAGSNKSFYDIAELAKSLQKLVDAKKKALEAALKDEHGSKLKELPAAARQLIEQEIEGAMSLARIREEARILELILTYYRDLTALSCKSPLHFEHRREALVDAYNQGQMLPLEEVQRAVQQAKLSLERQTSLQSVLESLLLCLFKP